MEISSDPYEQKLFNMFQSYNPNENGLNESALIKLCNSLELNDHGNFLIKSLITNKDSRVTFKAFKEALLNFLGGGTSCTNDIAPDIAKTLVINEEDVNDKYLYDGPISPGREISPKLVMGAKKYGRRSRPQSLVTDSSQSDSGDENENAVVPNIGNKLQKVQRSSSQSEIHGNPRRRTIANSGTKLKRCASLPTQRKQNPQNSKDQINTKSKLTSCGKINDQKQITSSAESLGNIDFENLSYNAIDEIWKSYTKELGRNNLKLIELKQLCERIGLFDNVAAKVADEVFEKLNFNKFTDHISFKEFIELIHGDLNGSSLVTTTQTSTSDETAENKDNNSKIIGKNLKEFFLNDGDGNVNAGKHLFNDDHYKFISFSNINNIIINAQNLHQRNNLCNTLMDSTCCTSSSSSIIRDLHVQDIPQQLETVPANSIVEMWDTSSVIDAKILLQNLGFDDNEVHIGQLSKVLEEELRGSQGDQQMNLLKASLALQKAEVSALQHTFRQLYEENKKLHADNKHANKRAALLAQEIDERHANLEDSTKTEIRLLEQRHAEVIKDLTVQLAADRENWSNLNARLEKRIKCLEMEETRLKNDVHALQEENNSMENEQTSLQKQITDLLETNIKLNNEIVEIEERQRSDLNTKDTEEVLELIDKITYLQVENTNLRDKNDELSSEVEGLNIELNRLKNKKSLTLPLTSTTQKSNSCVDSSSDILSDDPEHSSLATKRRGDSPSKAKLTEESPRTGKLRKCNNDNASNSESETSGDWVALNSELNTTNINSGTTATTSGFSQDYSSFSDTNDETKKLKDRIVQLEKEINDLKENKSTISPNDVGNNLKMETNALDTRCKELETSLDQMRKAYEDCEDYWQSKLNEERQIFDKERQIYEDEQNESDKKFSDLMNKVREYEEQYTKDDRLSPIEEKDILEQQFADMEAEVEQTRENARILFEEKTKEIDMLKSQIQELNTRLGCSNKDTVDLNDDCIINSCSSVCSGVLQKQQKHQSNDIDSPASSPISYLWNQSTIQAPARDYQNPNWSNKKISIEASRIKNLTTSETTKFSTTPGNCDNENDLSQSSTQQTTKPLNPIQKPNSIKSNVNNDDSSSTSSASVNSTDSSTHSIQKSSIAELSTCSSPTGLKEELKRLKFFEVQLREQIKDLAMHRDSLVMELQQLQEAKPVLEKAYARAAHPTLIQRVNLLEQKNRHLQTVLRQQQQYTESIMHQTWQQQRSELADLRNRLETQGIIMSEQAQRLTNADLLVKDLYVENSHLSATIQRLEQQRSRTNLMHQHHQQQQSSGLSGVPGMP